MAGFSFGEVGRQCARGREADRKRLLGHSFGNDLTNRVYGHRSIKELKQEIEKIQLRIQLQESTEG